MFKGSGKSWRTVFALLMGLVLILGQLFTAVPSSVDAVGGGQELPSQGLTAADATVTDQNGKVVQNPGQLTLWDNVKVQYHWSVGDDVKVQSGDYVTVTLPNGVEFSQVQSYPVVDPDNQQLVGNFYADKGATTGRITFGTYYQQHQYGKAGTLEFWARGEKNTGSDVTGNQDYARKIGWLIDETYNHQTQRYTQVQWQVAINPNNQYLKNVQVVDTIGTSNQTLAADTFHVTYAASGKDVPTSDYTVTHSGSNLTVTFKQDITEALNLLYATNITDAAYLATGAAAVMNNSFTMSGKLATTGGDVDFDTTSGSYSGQAQVRVGGSATGDGTEGKVTVNGHKVWADHDNQDGLRPSSIQIGVFANGGSTPVQTQTLTTPNTDFAFNGLDEVDVNGTPITYTVRELNVPDGYTSSVDDATNTITNTHEPATTTVRGTKTWSDKDDQDGIRPAKVTVALFANGQQTATKTVTAADNWQYEFTSLPEFAAGQKINYTVQELNVPDGYKASVDGFDVTNTHEPATTSVQGTKTWKDQNDQDGIRPSKVTVALFANGKQTAT
ncbi:Cna B-type domain-containing protein, partial [Lacticaseibacillus pantheris]